ncbi:hypothetical protein BN971_04392 [Mycobacterium bohemicum DSM 44277]|uniref:Uncharacterized protein n=1 Tax=Mycobacterium bohemicum DSM 44277 TaxID=1236609 RepID=A0A0U0WFI2_MYCBE|nr:hypothetical protein BN971_04392 [Mycobacterium bohemicum DSM 44277]
MKESRGLVHDSSRQRLSLAQPHFSVASNATGTGRLHAADRRLKDNIWLSPSLAAGAIAARVVCFLERRAPMRARQARQTYREVS